MPQLSSGLVIAGAYADKVRRVLFAQLKDAIKRGEISGKKVAERAGELNRLLFHIIVEKLGLDKGDAVRVRIEYEVKDGDIVWKLDTLQIEAFRRVSDEEVRKAIEDTVSKHREVLSRPVSEKEKAWTGAGKAEEEKAAQPPAVRAATAAGRTRSGERLVLLLGEGGEKIGLAALKPRDSGTAIEFILVTAHGAYRAEINTDEEPEELASNTERLVELANKAAFSPIDKKEAESAIRRRLAELL